MKPLSDAYYMGMRYLLNDHGDEYPDPEYMEWLEDTLKETQEALAEYENDETARRRADAHKIRQLKEKLELLSGKSLSELAEVWPDRFQDVTEEYE